MKVIMICADEAKNRGERDYAIAVGLQLAEQPDTDVVSYKISRSDQTTTGNAQDRINLALNNNEYEKIAAFDAQEVLEHIRNADGQVRVIGAGKSTYSEIMRLAQHTKDANYDVQYGFISHIISTEQENALSQTDIKVFAPISGDDLPKLALSGRLQTISSVPHTATAENMAYNAKMMTTTSENAAEIRNMINNDKPFTVVVLNAGFEVDGIHVPYQAKEGKLHGFALGKHLDDNTTLLLVDGGPRNLTDRKQGELTDKAFIQGYIEGQKSRNPHNNPAVIHEAFSFGLPYNSLYGALHFAQQDHCHAVISNAEGYGTMDTVMQFIDNQSKLSAMFPFEANEHIAQRMDNIRQYNQSGIACLFNENGNLVINRHANEQSTPIARKENPVSRILSVMGLDANRHNQTQELRTTNKLKLTR